MDIGICDDDMKTLLSLKETVTEYCKSKGLEGEVHLFASGGELLALSGHLDLLFLDIECRGWMELRWETFPQKNGRCKIVMETCREIAFWTLSSGGLPFPSETAEEAGRLGGAECLCKKSRGQQYHHAVGNAPAGGGFPAGHCVRPDLRQLYGIYCGRSSDAKRVVSSGAGAGVGPEAVFRINKKYIVNFSYIESYDNGELSIRKRR